MAGVVLALASSAGQAQVLPLPRPSGTPSYWVTAGGSFFNMRSFAGGDDGATWDFGDGFQFRASVERRVRRDITIGLAGTFARLPVDITDGGCGGCESDVNMMQGLALARFGGGDGYGFYNALELSGGVARFENFADAGAGPPTEAYRTMVPSFAASYGLGYSFWRGLDLALVQEFGLLIHEPVEGAFNDTSFPRFTSTRLEIRYAWR